MDLSDWAEQTSRFWWLECGRVGPVVGSANLVGQLGGGGVSSVLLSRTWCELTIRMLGSNEVAVDAIWQPRFVRSCGVQWALSLEALKRERAGSGFVERITF